MAPGTVLGSAHPRAMCELRELSSFKPRDLPSSPRPSAFPWNTLATASAGFQFHRPRTASISFAGIRRRSEQNSVHQFLVLIGDGGQLFGHGEHHMEVLSIEDLRPPVVQPSRTGQRLAFRAMPISAGVIRDALAAAMVTLLDMAAERGGPTEFDRRHDAALDGGQRGVMLLTISVAVAAEYIRDLQL